MSRILAIKLSSLGDIFHVLPALRCLKTGLDSEIDFVTQTEYSALAGCFKDVSRVIGFPRRRFVSAAGRFAAELRREKYDLVVDFQGLLKSAFVARMARGSRRIGPSFCREFAGVFYDEVAGKRDKNRHAVDENLDVVRHLGLACGPAEFPLHVPPLRMSEPHPRVVMIVSSRWPTKNWPLPDFARVAHMLVSRKGASVFVAGGPDDVEMAEEVRRLAGSKVINLAGRLSLVDLAGLLAETDLLVSNDTGPAHIAAALGTPVLALFGPTDHVRTGPYGAQNRVLTSNVRCRPCFSRRCRTGDVACMAGIGVDDVLAEAASMLDVRA
jgi:lipopolysaccharide heptosyltransferase I